MQLTVDDDLQNVAALMEANVPASKLIAVAEGLNAIARLLWERYAREGITPRFAQSFC
jgi:hypothetical protein